jgi:hypothetical protein
MPGEHQHYEKKQASEFGIPILFRARKAMEKAFGQERGNRLQTMRTRNNV